MFNKLSNLRTTSLAASTRSLWIKTFNLSYKYSTSISTKAYNIFIRFQQVRMGDYHSQNDNNGKENKESRPEFSEDELMLIARMYKLVGPRWSLIAGRIPGRTAKEIQSYFSSKYASSASDYQH